MKNLYFISILCFLLANSALSQGSKDLPEQQANLVKEYLKTVDRYKTENNKNQQAQYLNKIAYIYWEYQKSDEAVNYFSQSLEVNKTIGNQNAVCTIYGYIGNIYDDANKHDKAIENFSKSLDVAKKLNNRPQMASILLNLANAQAHGNKLEEANKNLLKVVEIAQESKNIKLLKSAYSSLAENYKKMGNNPKAMEYINLFLTFDKMIKEQEVNEVKLKSQVEVAKAESEKRAKELELNVQSYTLKSTTDSLKQIERISSEKQMQIELLNNQQKVQDLTIKEQDERHKFDLLLRYSLLSFILIIAGFSVVLIRQMNQKRKAHQMLVEMNKEVLDSNAQIEIQSIQLDMQNKELEKLSLAVSKIDNSVVISTADGTLDWANYAFTNLYGYTWAEFKEMCNSNFYESSSNKQIRTIAQESIDSKKSATYITKTFNKEGKELWIQTTLTPIFDNSDVLSKLIAVDSDITQIKVAEISIHDSITYASRIQNALIPSQENLQKILPESFVFFKPRDIVSGDFYWLKKIDNKVFLSVADCTGHGVPGAFMSLLGMSFLDQIIEGSNIFEPAKILNLLREKIISSLHQHKNGNGDSHKDGMDIALCQYDIGSKILSFAGAYNSLYIVRNREVIQVKADKMPVGVYVVEKNFTNKIVEVKHDDVFYIASDGYVDQFGGTRNEKFKSSRFHKLLVEIAEEPMNRQRNIFDKTHENWKGKYHQMDDITVIGFKLDNIAEQKDVVELTSALSYAI